jgi:membrane protease YdiL (CAAX protease family)
MPTMSVSLERNARRTWSILDAVLVGIAGLLLNLSFLFVAVVETRVHQLDLKFGPFQLSMGQTLMSLLASSLILGPVIALIIHWRQLGSWRSSIDWECGQSSLWSALSGGLLAIVYCLGATKLYGDAGHFRDARLGFSVTLCVMTSVALQPLVEEIYFRGILFVALEKRMGQIASITIVTLIFVWLHPGHRLDVLSVAVVLGITRVVTKSVASCFALHASYNLFLALYQLVV